jgi:hypothetical protein
LGTYNLKGTSEEADVEDLGWEFVKGTDVRNMLLVTEYVLDNVKFNDGLSGNTTGAYANSTLMAKMQDIYTRTGGSKTAICQNQKISMRDYTDYVKAIHTCTIADHIDTAGHHKDGMTGCTAVTIRTDGKANPVASLASQADISGVTFFALSIEEVAEAYNDTDYKVSCDYRRGKYAECGNGNFNTEAIENGTKVLAAYYWLRSPGYLSTGGPLVHDNGIVGYTIVSYAQIGARPACYATLA